MTALTYRPASSVLSDAADALDALVHDAAARAAEGSTDPLAYVLAGAAVASHLGLDLSWWIRTARAAGASWQTIADAIGRTKGNVHGTYRYVDGELS